LENIISDTVSTVKNYLSTVRIFFKGEIGFYFTFFEQDAKNRDGRKYFALLCSIFLFCLLGANIAQSGFVIRLSFFSSLYQSAIKMALSKDAFKVLLRAILIFVVILELLAFILGRTRGDREFLSAFNFATAAWFIILLTIFGLWYSLTEFVCNLLSVSDDTSKVIAGLLGLCLLAYLLYMYFAPYRGYELAIRKKHNLSIKKVKLILLQLGIPVIFFLALRPSFAEFSLEDPPKVDSVTFMNGPKGGIAIQIDSLGINAFKVKSEFVIENKHENNYIIDPRKQNFELLWDHRSKHASVFENMLYTDSIFFIDANNEKTVSINKDVPIYVSLEAAVDSIMVAKLLVCRACASGVGTLYLNTIDGKKIELATGKIKFSYRPEIISQSCGFFADTSREIWQGMKSIRK
jgi:hypothetical protein